MFLRIGFVELLISVIRLFDVIQRWKINFWWLTNWYITGYPWKEKYLPGINLESSQSSGRIPGNVPRFAICDGLIRGLSHYRMLLSISIYFLVIFFLFFIKIFVFIIFISFLDEVSNFHNRILTNQKPKNVIRNYQRTYM